MSSTTPATRPQPKVAKTPSGKITAPAYKKVAVAQPDQTTPVAVDIPKPKSAKRGDNSAKKSTWSTENRGYISASELRSILRMGYAIVAPVEELLERVERALPPINEEEIGDLNLSDQDTEPYDEDSDFEDMDASNGKDHPSHDA